MRAVKNTLLFHFVLAALAVVPVEFHSHDWRPTRIVGSVLTLTGFALWFLARLQLGRSFSIRPQAKELVTHGLYSKIRNPVYIFGSLVILGIILYVGRPEYLLIFAVIVPMQLLRISAEQKVLEAKFGDAYRQYKKSTWF
jgi:protein-S-isoprenylcysteine O-methyltransferase Ste14